MSDNTPTDISTTNVQNTITTSSQHESKDATERQTLTINETSTLMPPPSKQTSPPPLTMELAVPTVPTVLTVPSAIPAVKPSTINVAERDSLPQEELTMTKSNPLVQYFASETSNPEEEEIIKHENRPNTDAFLDVPIKGLIPNEVLSYVESNVNASPTSSVSMGSTNSQTSPNKPLTTKNPVQRQLMAIRPARNLVTKEELSSVLAGLRNDMKRDNQQQLITVLPNLFRETIMPLLGGLISSPEKVPSQQIPALTETGSTEGTDSKIENTETREDNEANGSGETNTVAQNTLNTTEQCDDKHTSKKARYTTRMKSAKINYQDQNLEDTATQPIIPLKAIQAPKETSGKRKTTSTTSTTSTAGGKKSKKDKVVRLEKLPATITIGDEIEIDTETNQKVQAPVHLIDTFNSQADANHQEYIVKNFIKYQQYKTKAKDRKETNKELKADIKKKDLQITKLKKQIEDQKRIKAYHQANPPISSTPKTAKIVKIESTPVPLASTSGTSTTRITRSTAEREHLYLPNYGLVNREVYECVPELYKDGFDPSTGYRVVLDQFKKGNKKWPVCPAGLKRYRICMVDDCNYSETQTANNIGKHFKMVHGKRIRRPTDTLWVDLTSEQFSERRFTHNLNSSTKSRDNQEIDITDAILSYEDAPEESTYGYDESEDEGQSISTTKSRYLDIYTDSD